MFTRKQYMNSECTLEEYYTQFATDRTLPPIALNEYLRITPSYNKHFVNYHYLCGFKYHSTVSKVKTILKPTTLSFSDVMLDGTRILIRGSAILHVKELLEERGFEVRVEDC